MGVGARRLSNMRMHLNCLNLRPGGYNTHSMYSLGTSSREETPAKNLEPPRVMTNAAAGAQAKRRDG
jgi:hypothetical protein